MLMHFTNLFEAIFKEGRFIGLTKKVIDIFGAIFQIVINFRDFLDQFNVISNALEELIIQLL